MTLEQASAWAGTARKESTNDPYNVNPSSKKKGLLKRAAPFLKDFLWISWQS